MKILHVTRETYAEQRYGMGRAVQQLRQGLQQQGVASLGWCCGDLGEATLALAQTRAAWAARRWGAQWLPLFEVVSRAWHTGAAAADLLRTPASADISHVHCHDAVVVHGYRTVPAARGGPGVLRSMVFRPSPKACTVFSCHCHRLCTSC